MFADLFRSNLEDNDESSSSSSTTNVNIKRVMRPTSSAAFDRDRADVSEVNKALERLRVTEESERAYRERVENGLLGAISLVDLYAPNDALDSSSSTLLGESEQHPGDLLVQKIEAFLDEQQRSFHQRKFQRAYLGSCLRLIYGSEEFRKHRHRIMSKYKFETEGRQQCLCALPRRFGKSYGTAMFMAVFALFVENQEISIFSPSKRQSIMFLQYVVDFVAKFGMTDRIVRQTEEKLWLSTGGGVSKVNSYPSSTKTLRGVSATLIVVDEFAHLDTEVLHQVILPLFAIDPVSMIGISTVTDNDNIMSQYLNLRDNNGRTVFYTLQVYQACAECREKGDEAAESCNHNQHVLPSWQSARKKSIIKAMMQGSEHFRSEILGIVGAAHERAFEPKHVNNLFEVNKRFVLQYDVHYPILFIAIDPSGCGKSSDMAICSFIHQHGARVIIGMESFPGKTGLENITHILRHVRLLERLQFFNMTRKVFIIENNLGNEADYIAKAITDNVNNCVIMNNLHSSTAKSKVGLRTTNAVKTQAVEHVRNLLRESALFFVMEQVFVSTHENVIKLFREEMEYFSEIIKDKDFDKPKRFFSGKRSSHKDDLVLATLFGLYWSQKFMSSNEYSGFR